MKAGDLKKVLENVDDSTLVIIQKDPEGNGYSTLEGADLDTIYDQEDQEVYDLDSSADDNLLTDEEWKEFKEQFPKCVTLYPTT